MSIIIKEADLDQDRDILIELLRKNRSKIAEDFPFEARYDWLYKNNPHGRAKAWLAIDGATAEAVGFTIAIPRKMIVNGKNIICWNCADFSVNKKYRTLGVAIKLRKAAKEGVDNGQVKFLYAHPNNNMLVVHLKAGHQIIGTMHRYAKYLQLDQKINKHIGSNKLSRILSCVGNFVLVLTRIKEFQFRKKNGNYFIKNDRLCHEYDELFKRLQKNYVVCGIRDQIYLKWRYLNNPLYKSDIFAIYTEKLVGYIIYVIKENAVNIKDIFCENKTTAEYLLANFIVECRKQSICSISISFLDSFPLINVFKSFFFKCRSDSLSSMVVYSNCDSELSSILLDGSNWYVTVGDRDV